MKLQSNDQEDSPSLGQNKRAVWRTLKCAISRFPTVFTGYENIPDGPCVSFSHGYKNYFYDKCLI